MLVVQMEWGTYADDTFLVPFFIFTNSILESVSFHMWFRLCVAKQFNSRIYRYFYWICDKYTQKVIFSVFFDGRSADHSLETFYFFLSPDFLLCQSFLFTFHLDCCDYILGSVFGNVSGEKFGQDRNEKKRLESNTADTGSPYIFVILFERAIEFHFSSK